MTRISRDDPAGTAPAVRRPLALVVAGVATGLVTVSAIGTTGLMSYLARILLLPDHNLIDDVRIEGVQPGRIILSKTGDSVLPGRYGLWFPNGHLRVGDVLHTCDRSVTRSLTAIDAGVPQEGPARWNGWYYARDPGADLGMAYEDVVINSDVGELPAWVVTPDAGEPGTDAAPLRGTWAVLVHGRGGRRPECLRALPVLTGLGATCLISSYRNDPDAPASPDGRYNLGLSEWRDVEAGVRFALARGARDVVLVGWSMGGAAVLQMLDRSAQADAVSAVVLDSPVIDWGDVLRHHAREFRLPQVAATTLTHLIGQRWARRLVGVHEPLDVAQTNWERRADELRHPILLIHSGGDEVVPIGPSQVLAQARPDLVRWEPWTVARHTQAWNVDPVRWEAAVAGFLTGVRRLPRPSRAATS